MFKTFAIAGLATALLFGAVPAHALITGNALTENALTQNGLDWNALTDNALTANALTGNSLTTNALTQNSIRPTGVTGRQNLGTTTGLHIIAVELPVAR